MLPGEIVVVSGLRPCKLTEIRKDGRFQFSYTTDRSNISIYYREDVDENERAMNELIPEMYKSYKP